MVVPVWIDYTAAMASLGGLLVASVTLWAAVKAREAARQAREAVHAKNMADSIGDAVHWTSVLAHAAQEPDTTLFRQIATEMLPRLRQLVSKYPQGLATHRRALDQSLRQLTVCLEAIAGAWDAQETHDLRRQMARAALNLQETVATACGHAAGLADEAAGRE